MPTSNEEIHHEKSALVRFGCPLPCGRARHSVRAAEGKGASAGNDGAHGVTRPTCREEISIFFERFPSGQRMPFMTGETERSTLNQSECGATARPPKERLL